MAAGTLGKVSALAESALPIVASDAVLRTRIRKMLHRRDGTDLARLRQTTSPHIVTTLAGQTLTRAVVSVTETYSVRAGSNRSRGVSAEPVTGAT